MKLCVPCLFGLEGLAADELRYMGMSGVEAETGRVFFNGGFEELARANLRLRTGERVQILMGEFPAKDFDALFEGVYELPWENIIPRDGAFPVKGHSLNSTLHSVPTCQGMIKKAVVKRLSAKYGMAQFPETGGKYQIRFSLINDVASIFLDTSGAALHKRGYRPNANLAPLRETLAAAMVKLARFKGRDIFCDPFCGSGTIAIEAALAAMNRAPGIGRRFAAETWSCIDRKIWRDEREAARDGEYHGDYRIFASDIDPACIDIARENAKRAGVDGIIHFSCADALRFVPPAEGRGIIMANPPYGERLLDVRQAEELYRSLGRIWKKLDDWSFYILTSDLDFEKCFGRRADKRRKVYNGMIQCQLYMYKETAKRG